MPLPPARTVTSMKAPPRTDFGVCLRILPSTATPWLGSSLSPCTGGRNEQVVGLFFTEACITLVFSRYFLSQRLPPPERTISLNSPWLDMSFSYTVTAAIEVAAPTPSTVATTAATALRLLKMAFVTSAPGCSRGSVAAGEP